MEEGDVRKVIIATALAAAALALGGCAGMFSHGGPRHHRSSSLVDYLYAGKRPPAEVATPVLNLPLTVGLAFLPPAAGPGTLDATEKNRILDQVRERFKGRRFVREIVPIPDYYLQGQRGFGGLESLQRLYNLDLVALVSYDQVANQHANELSLAYLTIVGAYLFPGTSQDVSTLVDLAVIHPASQSLVLRAAGMDSRSGVSTEAGSEGRLRERSVRGFQAAAAQMIDRFDSELLRFEQDVRDGKARVKVAGGAGSFDWLALALLAALGGTRIMLSLRTAAVRKGICTWPGLESSSS
jgi:rhombotail lipoprotein